MPAFFPVLLLTWHTAISRPGFIMVRLLSVCSAALIVYLAAICCPAYGANPQAARLVRVPVVDGADIHFVPVSLERATVRGIINRIVQDDRGFLWFGTNHGLLRYDGYQFRAFVPDSDDPNSIRGTSILALTKDRLGRLWVGSDQQVDKYDPITGVFQHILPDAANVCGPAGIVRDIAQDRQGIVWVAMTMACFVSIHRRQKPAAISIAREMRRVSAPI